MEGGEGTRDLKWAPCFPVRPLRVVEHHSNKVAGFATMRPSTMLLAAGAAALLRVSALAQAPAQPVAVVEFELHRNKILVPVSVAGRGPHPFILDTGAPVTLLTSRARAEELALRLRGAGQVGGAGAGSALPAQVSQGVDIALGGLSLGEQRLLVLDLASELAGSSGRYYDGIIGRLLFDRYVVRLDFERRVLELYPPDAYRVPDEAAVVPIRLENGHPHVDTRITTANGDAVDVDLVIDTGAKTALMLDGDRRPELVAPDDAVEMIIGHGAQGLVRGRVSRVRAVALGDTVIRDVLAAFVDDALGTSPGADGNLGTEILRRFVVTIDYPGRRFVLEPGPRLDEPFAVDLSGITLRAGGTNLSELSVRDVRPNSPAHAAGVREGDVIARVDGHAPEALAELERRLQQAGSVHLELLRGGESVFVELMLRPFLD